MKISIYSDGGSRGNPGPAAYAFIIVKNNKIIMSCSERIGIATNNIAEYKGLINGLKKAGELMAKTVNCYSDSQLVVNQLNGKYLVKAKHLLPLFIEIKKITPLFEKVSFMYVPRTNKYIQISDALLNKELDS